MELTIWAERPTLNKCKQEKKFKSSYYLGNENCDVIKNNV